MPGRTISSTARTRRTTSTKNLRSSSPVTEVPEEGPDSSLRRAVCTVFADSQKSTSAHRKACITLRKLQEACCYEPTSGNKKPAEEFDEDDFNREVIRCLLRILPVKKAEPVGDRVVRFVGTYLNEASQKDIEILQQDADDSALPETPTSRLTTQILSTLLPLLQAKDKTVRFRATQITSHIINSLDTLDDNVFHQLRFRLLKRIHDKEAPVRLQAVYGLGRLAAEVDEEDDENSDSDDDVGAGVLAKLLNILQNDPAAEVRRNLLLNLPFTKEVLPYLLERARDADPSTRRALYGHLLPSLGDFRHLSLTHREKLLRWGLRDRDEAVRKAAAKLFCERWIEDCAALPAGQASEEDEQSSHGRKVPVPSMDALLELLERIDVVNSGTDGGIALIAMNEFWRGRSDYVDYVSFPDTFWDDLSPEIAFVARTFNDFCRTAGAADYFGPQPLIEMVEEKLPEVTKFGFLLEREISKLIEATIKAATEDDDDEAEEDVHHREFIVEQMLQMALTFDYSDEVGRRKMYAMMRNSLALPDLPEEVTHLAVDVLRLVCGEDAKGERDFCGVVLEAIAEVHDTIMGEDDATEDSFVSATSQPDDDNTVVVTDKGAKKTSNGVDPEAEADKAVREIMVNMKCLHIAQCMLQNVQCDIEENVHLVTMLNTLVVPAVRSQEAPVRERGLICLGLCCLLGKNLAQENLTVFLHCFTKGAPALQATALQIITDILITHPTLLSDQATSDESETEAKGTQKLITKAYKKSLGHNDSSVQSTGAIALSKAMLSRLITDADLLKQLVVTYFDPDSVNNPQFRQTLSYFLPVYCHSNADNAIRMAEITCSTISRLHSLRETYAEDAEVEEDMAAADSMVKMNLIGQMLLDWTDPRKIIGFAESANVAGAAQGAAQAHFIIAESILERLVTSQVPKDEKRVLFSMLNKVHFPTSDVDSERVRTVLELCAEAIETKVAGTATDKNVLVKIQNNLLKIMHDVMTEERGGGGAEETVLDTLEADAEEGDSTTQAGQAEEEDADEGETEDDDVTQLQQEMRDATISATTEGFTTGLPDAEGTRFDEMDDSEMMDVDD